MRFKVGDRILFLTKHQFECHQVMAEVINTYPGDVRKGKAAYVRSRVMGSDQVVPFDPNVPESMVRVIPKEIKNINEALLWLSANNVPMGEENVTEQPEST